MDALSSQANVGGYKAVLIAADAFGRYFPLLTTAAGTAKPANVLILGIGVAGLQAIGTARRLGAVVKAYDVRPETQEQAESLGAQFVEPEDGRSTRPARAATPASSRPRSGPPSRRSSTSHIGDDGRRDHDRPGPGPQAAGARHRGRGRGDEAGLGHRRHGGVARSAATASCRKAGETIVTDNGVTIIAPDNLPATMPVGASAFYARNISALLLEMVKDGALDLDFEDEVTKSTVITHGGAGRPARRSKKLLEPAPAAPAGGAA